jgi:phosphoglycolate phosphatase-like HAD superfamily hydrolase
VHRALAEELGVDVPIDGYRLDGKTDPQIVRELLTLAGVAETEIGPRLDAVYHRYLRFLEAELTHPEQATRLLAGVRELLDALLPHEAAGRALVGLLTGNLEHGAGLKLRSAGLTPARFAIGAYGSDCERRTDLPAVAARRATERTGREFRGSDVVIIGDTPADVACARPLGARAVAVATGFYGADVLRDAGAASVFPDLGDTRAVLAALLE